MMVAGRAFVRERDVFLVIECHRVILFGDSQHADSRSALPGRALLPVLGIEVRSNTMQRISPTILAFVFMFPFTHS
jgi:hypothetical protein